MEWSHLVSYACATDERLVEDTELGAANQSVREKLCFPCGSPEETRSMGTLGEIWTGGEMQRGEQRKNVELNKNQLTKEKKLWLLETKL